MVIKPTEEKCMYNGTHKIYKFKNGYGASVIRTIYSFGHEHGLWELAIIKFNGDDWEIVYDTPISDDVIGNLTLVEVEEYLHKINDLTYSCIQEEWD